MSVSLIDGHIDDDTMTDNEIIKALENNKVVEALEGCVSDNSPCHICKYDGDNTTVGECMGELMKDALDLINRQKAEIERLEKDSKRLKKVQMQLDDATKMYTTIKAEAIKEFAEKVKGFMDDVPMHSEEDFIYVDYFELRDKIDNLVKLMVGEASG